MTVSHRKLFILNDIFLFINADDASVLNPFVVIDQILAYPFSRDSQ